jgi:hypothetical protein
MFNNFAFRIVKKPKNKMRFLPLSLLLICYSAIAQIDIRTDGHPFFLPADSQKLMFHIENKNFLKNNEYFNQLNEGYTLIGFVAKPTLVYHPGATTRLETGISLLKYDGRDGFSNVEPLLRFQYQPVSYFQVVMGAIYGGANHGLIEPIYQWERDLMYPVENGLQFLFNADRIKADIWLQWVNFIFRNDPFQEQLRVGSSISWKLLPGEHDFNVYLPFQSLIEHHGGQSLSVDLPMQTIANFATGVKTSWQTGGHLFKQCNFDFWYIGYNDLSPQKLQAYKRGFSLYPKTEIIVKSFMLQAGYYHGDHFLTSIGEPLFCSATIPYNGYYTGVQNLVTAKIAYQKKIEKGISLAAYFEAYTNTGLQHTDYTYGIHLLFDRDFFITKIK